MPRSLSIDTLVIRGFRNLANVDLRLGPRFNVIAGDNGQGKTNLLEAVYAVLTSKSFRTSKPGELVAHGGEVGSVRARVDEEGTLREQTIGVKRGARLVRIDGKRPKTLAEFAVASPVVLFHPGALSLSMGGGAERRRLLDRVALYASPVSLSALDNYAKAVRARQRVLEQRGCDASDLDEWETLAVQHGIAVMDYRAKAAFRLCVATLRAFERIAPPNSVLEIDYFAGAPLEKAAYLAKLRDRRVVDIRRGGATVGPHRDDLTLRMGSHPVRGIASQGQHRAIVLSLKLAEIEVIEETRGVRPVLLLDDVSSELDRSRTSALFAFLQAHRGQVLLTTTRPELIDTGTPRHPDDRVDFGVQEGRVTATAPSSAPAVPLR